MSKARHDARRPRPCQLEKQDIDSRTIRFPQASEAHDKVDDESIRRDAQEIAADLDALDAELQSDDD